MTPDVISKFSGNYSFLSNFYPSPILREHVIYPTVEHAFQAMKSLNTDTRLKISQAPGPKQAKYMGREVLLRLDWDDVKLDVMKDILKVKFSDPKLKDLLIGTRQAHLAESNTWGDRFWGQVDGVGHNHLGKLLMQIREGLQL
jgi:ribA/ribD-fused uncharacterized protein